jgi:hypothetical protein
VRLRRRVIVIRRHQPQPDSESAASSIVRGRLSAGCLSLGKAGVDTVKQVGYSVSEVMMWKLDGACAERDGSDNPPSLL